MISRLDFVAIPSQDAERTRAFYVDTLGLRPDNGARFEFWAGETCFGIYEPERVGRAPHRGRPGQLIMPLARRISMARTVA